METATFAVRKRDGVTVQPYKRDKLRLAIQKSWEETGLPLDNNTLDEIIANIADRMEYYAENNVIDVEKIQDLVEMSLMKYKHFEVAKAYILFRSKRAEVREARLVPDSTAISSYIHPAKYGRYIPELQRREVYEETVARVEKMHLDKFNNLFNADPELEKDIRWAFDLVRDKRVLPSMRAMQFAGPAIETVNARIFNCSATAIDRISAFSEAFYLLLCGCGVGFSVQFEHIDKLPILKHVDSRQVRHFTIADTIEGWADSLQKLMDSYVKGYTVEFNYSRIRPEGAPLKTSGGKAPGHRYLKKSLEQIRGLLDQASGRRLRSIECHDIMCIIADAVLSGGIRRSSLISLFSLEDSEMMNAKTGRWYEKFPWRANANNSVMLKRDEVKKKSFKRVFEMTRQFGEPGFIFCNDYDHLGNPCFEVGLYPTLNVDDDVISLLEQRSQRGKKDPQIKLGSKYSGFSFCNLCEINGAKLKEPDDFRQAAKAAAIIGTLQASYTDLSYLGWVSEVIAEREALLGVGITGIMDSPDIALNRDLQQEVAKLINEVNKEYASRIGIRQSARCTVVKPSGTSSLELGGVGSGHHPHHARRYIRRVTANELEPTFQYFKSINPHLCAKKSNGDWVIEFPVQAPDGATVKSDLTALEFLESVKQTQINWVLPGTARPESTPGINHNVSNTCVVKELEWEEVSEYLWENKDYFTGVSFIPDTGDKIYAFSPMEAVITEADEERWNHLIKYYTPVDYTKMTESEDGTNLSGEASCVGGACEL